MADAGIPTALALGSGNTRMNAPSVCAWAHAGGSSARAAYFRVACRGHASTVANMTTSTRTGGCQCGALRYEIRAGLGRASICHCRMCQKAFGNAFAPLVTAKGLVWSRGEPKRFRSSNKVSRGFCGECGTPMTYEPDGFEPEIAIATLDDASQVLPAIQVGLESRLGWCLRIGELPTRSPEEAAKVAVFFGDIVSRQHPDR